MGKWRKGIKSLISLFFSFHLHCDCRHYWEITQFYWYSDESLIPDKAKALVKMNFEDTGSKIFLEKIFMRFFMSFEHVVWRFMTFTMIFGSLATFESLLPARLFTWRHLGSIEREKWDMKCFLRLEHLAIWIHHMKESSFTSIPPVSSAFLIIKLSFYHVQPLCESFSNFFYFQCGFYVCLRHVT